MFSRRLWNLILTITVFYWTDDSGTTWFVDDIRKVPAKYEEQAKSRVIDGLGSYEKYTHASGN